jgi:glycine cleavage system H lipoate-binding protein
MGTKDKGVSMKIVPPGRKKCVWMEAGVVSYKLCENNYDCSTCVYDHAMQAKVARQKEAVMMEPVEVSLDRFTETWVEKMMLLPASQRKCRYMITGEVGRKLCPNAYECGNCSFDQMMQGRMQAEPLPVQALSDASGFDLAEGTYYHDGHTWAKPEYGGRVRVGLDDFAQRLLGNLTAIQIPDVGRQVKQGEVGFHVRRNGDRIALLSPVDGVILRTNHRVLDNPRLINESPYEQGWLFIVEPTGLRKNLKGMYFGEEAHTYMAEEKEKLFSMASERSRIAADGGDTVENILGEMEDKRRAEFVRTFLKTKT